MSVLEMKRVISPVSFSLSSIFLLSVFVFGAKWVSALKSGIKFEKFLFEIFHRAKDLNIPVDILIN